MAECGEEGGWACIHQPRGGVMAECGEDGDWACIHQPDVGELGVLAAVSRVDSFTLFQSRMTQLVKVFSIIYSLIQPFHF